MAKSSFSTRMLPLLGVLLAGLILSAGALLYLEGSQSQTSGGQAELGRIVAGAQSARALTARALSGDLESFDQLDQLRSEIRIAWQTIQGDAAMRANLGSVAAGGNDIDELLAAIDRFVESREALQNVEAATQRVARLAGQARDSVQALLSQSPVEVREANQPFIEWLQQTVNAVQSAVEARGVDRSASETEEALIAAGSYVSEISGGLIGRSASLGIQPLTAATQPDDVANVTRIVDEIELAISALGEDVDAIQAAEDSYTVIDAAATAIMQRYRNAPIASAATNMDLLSRLPLYLLGASVLVLIIMMFAFFRARELSKTADVHVEQNERNQQAILRLLDELSNLADGDLTVEATVTEDITGAIADSINFAIDALRELVLTIKDSSILVDAAAKQSETTAHQLVRATATQAKQAVSASNSIMQMASSVEEVSANAERCSDVARHSVEVAHKGGDAVRRTIEGMNTIRETIQDTSKRIKRLGESSQEIGNIVELIEEIAEQTNILALNASIEASRAGEASRGFAVVADEVQKLAERSTNATRKIEVLVSTIQSDTNEAVTSMERSTTDVVGGALLAENAGAALDEIEQVSHQIASLVQNISASAREQTGVASAISRNMDVLREISTRAKQSTTAASSSISKLSELASQLRQTVSGFALPEQDGRTGVLSGRVMTSDGEGVTAQTLDVDQTVTNASLEEALLAESGQPPIEGTDIADERQAGDSAAERRQTL